MLGVFFGVDEICALAKGLKRRVLFLSFWEMFFHQFKKTIPPSLKLTARPWTNDGLEDDLASFWRQATAYFQRRLLLVVGKVLGRSSRLVSGYRITMMIASPLSTVIFLPKWQNYINGLVCFIGVALTNYLNQVLGAHPPTNQVEPLDTIFGEI